VAEQKVHIKVSVCDCHPSDAEQLAKLRTLRAASQAEREAAALVKEAAKKHNDLKLAYYGAGSALSTAQDALWGEFEANPLLSCSLKPAKPPELTQREHEVWLTAYSAAHASAQTSGGGSAVQSELASKSARIAVEAYRALVSGGTQDP
jgi:hypothetical protein